MIQNILDNCEVLIGDCLQTLKELPDTSIHCCITSPPYFGLRDYGHDNQIGLEKTPEEYVQKMVEVFREVKRVLRDDGTLWLNIGDSYAGSGKGGQSAEKRSKGWQPEYGNKGAAYGLKPKDLIGIPWMLAFALRADGWYLRQDIIWHKPNPMPEPVKDRCTKAHEYIFLLSKSKKYYYDHEAVKEPLKSSIAYAGANKDGGYDGKDLKNYEEGWEGSQKPSGIKARTLKSMVSGKRNKRSVWIVNTKPFKGAHFAVFPPKLIEPCILAGCPVGGTVLDPFGGSGTTAGVALLHNRKAILCELNEEYVNMIPKRIEGISGRNKNQKSIFWWSKDDRGGA